MQHLFGVKHPLLSTVGRRGLPAARGAPVARPSHFFSRLVINFTPRLSRPVNGRAVPGRRPIPGGALCPRVPRSWGPVLGAGCPVGVLLLERSVPFAGGLLLARSCLASRLSPERGDRIAWEDRKVGEREGM